MNLETRFNDLSSRDHGPQAEKPQVAAMNLLSNGWHRRRPGLGRRLTLVGVCVSAPLLGPAACRVERLEARGRQTVTSVAVPPVVPAPHPAKVAATGTIAPGASVDLTFRVAGTVMAIGVDEGEQVAAGELVAVLDATEYVLNFEQAKLEYLGAAGEAQRLQASATAAGAAPNNYNEVMAAAALAKVAAARAEKRLYDTRLASPLAGVVARRAVQPGEIVSPGAPAFTIVNIDVVRLRVSVPESEIAGISRGADVTITVPALDGAQFAGKVRIVGVVADPADRAFTVEIEVPNPEHRLKPGMSASASIGAAESTTSAGKPRVAA